jgi:hypothetical protein
MNTHVNDDSGSGDSDAPRFEIERVTLTPKEFAAKFGRSPTWALRLIYAGKIKVLEDFRPRLIPITEVDRFLRKATRFTGNKKKQTRSS